MVDGASEMGDFVNLIVLVDCGFGIGKDGRQTVCIKEDRQRFAELTKGHTIIVGRKTLATFPGGRPLKERDNIILTHDRQFSVDGARTVTSLKSLLAIAPNDAFVVGGANVYQQLFPYCETAYLTEVRGVFPADAYFPRIDWLPNWELMDRSQVHTSGQHKFQFCTYWNETPKSKNA